MAIKTIFDKHISFKNFATFKQCQILANGRAIRVIFACGARYDIPVRYVLQWSPHPHYMLINGELKEWEDGSPHPDVREDMLFVKCERIVWRTAIRVSLNNDTLYEIPWDTVLMACEPRYEHFGGWTTDSRKIVDAWHRNIREQAPETRLYARKLRVYNVNVRRSFCGTRISRILSRRRIRLQRRRFSGGDHTVCSI